jgi:hypothetical protein
VKKPDLKAEMRRQLRTFRKWRAEDVGHVKEAMRKGDFVMASINFRNVVSYTHQIELLDGLLKRAK